MSCITQNCSLFDSCTVPSSIQTVMQRKWFRYSFPWKAKSIKTDGVSSPIVRDAPQRSRANSFDSMDAFSSASSGVQADSKMISLQKTDTVAASVPSSLKKLTSITLHNPESISDESTQASSVLTACSAAASHDISATEDNNCFDDLSVISAETDLHGVAAVEKHIVEWEFTPNMAGWYSGPLMDNSIPHGRGSCVLDNGDKYEGPFHEGKMHGPSAELIKSDGSVYKGDVFNNVPHGYGTYRTSRRRYVGQLEFGIPHGQGAQYYLDGSLDFEGQWIFGETVVGLEELDIEMLAELVNPMSIEAFIAAMASDNNRVEGTGVYNATRSKDKEKLKPETKAYGEF